MKLTPTQVAALAAAKISFSVDRQGGWHEGGILAMPTPDVTVEEYSSFFTPTTFYSTGAFSYSWSPFPGFVTVGRYCSIAGGVEIIPSSHPTHLFTTSSMLYDASLMHRKLYCEDVGLDPTKVASPEQHPSNGKWITIGNDVYIGTWVRIRQGVDIGDGAIIGAGSVVTKSVPPYAVVAGNPAQVVRMRYDQETIDALLAARWWDYDFSQVTEIASSSRDVTPLLEAISRGSLSEFNPAKHRLVDVLNC